MGADAAGRDTVACTREGAPANAPSRMSYHKYRPFAPIPFDDVWTERKWPSRVITRAPRWCSVDLRDGNQVARAVVFARSFGVPADQPAAPRLQALINPMDMAKKLKLFEHLVKLAYKEIEARCATPTCRPRR